MILWAGDLGYDITAFDIAAGIEPVFILCLGITACEANGTRAGRRVPKGRHCEVGHKKWRMV